MAPLLSEYPWLLAMLALTAASAFFSGTEAALFSLRVSDRKAFQQGSTAQRRAVELLVDPDRLLAAILFWNLLVNSLYFAMTSIVGLHLEKAYEDGTSATLIFSSVSVLWLIFFGEMLAKSVGVLMARSIAPMVSVPMGMMTAWLDPLMPILSTVNILSRRLIWPEFESEPYLEVADLERAVELSTTDAELAEQEQMVLRNIVSLGELRADELMRPRNYFVSFRPGVTLADLGGKLTASGYLLITEPRSDNIASAINLVELGDTRGGRLEHFSEPVLHVPWCATAADVFHEMQLHDREVAAVVNEFGETIGILTLHDILDTIFTTTASRSARLLHRRAIQEIEPGRWQVTGMTSLSRLEKTLGLELPPTKNLTVQGIIQEALQRMPTTGDQGDWGPIRFRVLESSDRGPLLVEIEHAPPEEVTA